MNKSDIIKNFEQKKILLIGDTILDVYTYGQEVCKSSDSEATEIEEEKTEVSFGGASLIANNILELGGKVVFFSMVGNDESAKEYNAFSHPNLTKNFLVDESRPTIVKKRYWVNNEKVLQTNQVDNKPLSAELTQELLSRIEPFLKEIDLIVVLDAQHGLMSEGLISNLVSLAQKYQKPLYVDSQISHRPSNHHLYKGADCLFLNETEAKAIYPEFNLESQEASLKEIKNRLNLNNVVVKLGETGSTAFFNDKHVKAPAYSIQVVDPCGAGDTFLAAFSLGDRQAIEETLAVANAWAALSATVYGTTPPKKQELIEIYG